MTYATFTDSILYRPFIFEAAEFVARLNLVTTRDKSKENFQTFPNLTLWPNPITHNIMHFPSFSIDHIPGLFNPIALQIANCILSPFVWLSNLIERKINGYMRKRWKVKGSHYFIATNIFALQVVPEDDWAVIPVTGQPSSSERSHPEVDKFLPLKPMEFFVLGELLTGPMHATGLLRNLQKYFIGSGTSVTGTGYRAIKKLQKHALIVDAIPPDKDQIDARITRVLCVTQLGKDVFEKDVALRETLISKVRMLEKQQG